jgi:hypothetical protein
LVRATTPKYSRYSYKPSAQFKSLIDSDPDPIVQAVLEHSTGRINKEVDVDQASTVAGVARADVVRKLQDWSDNGIIKLTPSGVVNRYRMIKPFPRNQEDIKKLIDMAYEQMETREMENLQRCEQVIKLITSPKCFALALATHFGDEASLGDTGCGRCQFCITGKSICMVDSKIRKAPVDDQRVEAILAACSARDDPRLLARIAFGISSPRAREERCGPRSTVFGSMGDCDFDVSAMAKCIAFFSLC